MKRLRLTHGPWQGFPAWTLACAVSAFVQATWVAELTIARPSLAAILIAHIGLRARRERLLPALIVLGAMTSLFTVEPVTSCVIAAIAIGLLMLLVRPFLFADHLATRAIVIFVTACVVVAAPLVGRTSAARPDLVVEAVGSVFVSALVTAAVGVVADAALLRVGFCRRLAVGRRLELAS